MACETIIFDTGIDASGDITCKRADTFALNIEFIYEDDESPYDLEQFDEVKMNCKTDAKAATYVLQFSTEVDGGMTVAGSVMSLAKTADEMKITSATLVYDVQGVTGAEVLTIGSGNFTITPDVTRTDDTPEP